MKGPHTLAFAAVACLFAATTAQAQRPRAEPEKGRSASTVERGARWERPSPQHEATPPQRPPQHRVEPGREKRDPVVARPRVEPSARWRKGDLSKHFNERAAPPRRTKTDPPPRPEPRPPNFPAPR